MKNLKEFNALKKRYESITLEEIKKEPFKKYWTAQKLTGYGDIGDCTLCEVIDWWNDCNECVYLVLTGDSCDRGINEKTYKKINIADFPLTLRDAYHARAKHMKTLI